MVRRGPKTRGPNTEKQWEEFEKLCEYQCTKEEIASWFNCHKDTLLTRVEEHYGEKYSAVYSEKRGRGKISLRRAQWQKAVDGKSVPMLIWLGKQYLGQSDRQDPMSSVEDLVFTASIGEGGQIIQTIRSAKDWELEKKYNIKGSLEKIKEEATKRLEEREEKKE